MGRAYTSMTVTASLSRHNSALDVEDDQLWAELVERVRAIVREDRYAAINAGTDGGDE